jgi:hypothetical protein
LFSRPRFVAVAFALTIAAILHLRTSPAAAQAVGSLAVTPTGPAFYANGDRFGFSFQVTSPIRVTALAAYCYDSTSTHLNKCVALWRDSLRSDGFGEFSPLLPAQFIAGAVVSPYGPKIPFSTPDGFRQHHTFAYTEIDPVVLTIGSIYVVALAEILDPAHPGNGSRYLASSYDPPFVSFVSGPGIAPFQGRMIGGACGTFPTMINTFVQTFTANFGANFLYEVIPPTDVVPGNTGIAFALQGVRPNPSRGEVLTVSFSLPSTQPATLELLDVTGRRIVQREVGSPGAGPRTLDLREGQRLAPGLYLVRLTQGTNTRTTRAVVLR